jgi:predicted transposase YdaD
MTPAEYASYEDELNERRLENGVRNALISDARNEGLVEGKAEGKAEGLAEGLAKGEAKGRAKGRAEGEAKGRAEGVMEGKREMARALKANGMSIADIARFSGLSQNEVADSLKKK